MAFSRIQSLRLAAVVEDCSHKLGILGHTLQVQINRERGRTAEQEKLRLNKLKTDCESIAQQMSELYIELEEKHTFNSLLCVVEQKEQQIKDEEMKRKLRIMVNEKRQSLLNQIAEANREKEEEENACTPEERQLKIHAEAMMIKNCELRLQMKEQEISKAEKLMQYQLDGMQKKLNEDETRVHEEAVKFLQNQQEELHQLLLDWQERTKQLQHDKKTELNNVCCQKTLNYDRLMDMRRKYKSMRQVVTEEREEQEKIEQQKHEVKCATKVQAIWRGHMVRRGLGPFKDYFEKKKEEKDNKDNKDSKDKKDKKDKKEVKKKK